MKAGICLAHGEAISPHKGMTMCAALAFVISWPAGVSCMLHARMWIRDVLVPGLAIDGGLIEPYRM